MSGGDTQAGGLREQIAATLRAAGGLHNPDDAGTLADAVIATLDKSAADAELFHNALMSECEGRHHAEAQLTLLRSQTAKLGSDSARLSWFEKASGEHHPHVPYLRDDGKWVYPYLVSGHGFGGGVGEAAFDTFREAIDAALREAGQ